MEFYRVIESLDVEDDCPDYWVCKNCIDKSMFENFEILDETKDGFGDHTCENCGLYYDHEDQVYYDQNGNTIREEED